jgi:hypothetical protein
MAASNDGQGGSVDLSSLIPFSIESDAQRLTIKEAIASNVCRDPGQLDIQWGDGKKYGLRYRSCDRCVRVVGQEDANPGPET